MLTHLNSIFRFLLLTIIVSGLVACGGGDGGGTPPPPKTDTIPPKVVATSPSSEQSGVRVNTDIKVTFDKNISSVSSSNVGIYPYVSGAADKSKAVEFKVTNTSTSLVITPTIGALNPATTYQVVITAIKNSDGAEMTAPCEWIFATEGSATISTGLTGVCSSVPQQGKPGEVQNVKAIAGDNSATISWLPPKTGGTPTFYSVERTSDNKQSYTAVNRDVPASTLTIEDPDALNGTTYIYKIIARNNLGESTAVFSKAVTPNPGQVASAPGTPQITGITASDGSVTINWTAPTTGGAVTYYKVDKSVDNQKPFTSVNPNVPATTVTYTDPNAQNGKSHIYKVTAGNGVELGAPALSNAVTPVAAGPVEIKPSTILSSQPSAGDIRTFGFSLAISPDGSVLAVGNGGGIRAVQLFINSNGSWNPGPVLIIDNTSLAFSPDGLTLAVGNFSGTSPIQANAGNVTFFTRSGTSWNSTPTQVAVFSSPLAPSSDFGKSLAFSPDGLHLAVADSTNNKVDIFTRTGSSWNAAPTTSQVLTLQSNGGNFGDSLAFNSDSTALIIIQPNTDLIPGKAHIFTKSSNIWSFASIINLAVVTAGTFGRIAFSPGDSAFAVGDGAGTVQIFNKSGNTWNSMPNSGPILSSFVTPSRLNGDLAFSPDDKQLAIRALSTGIQIFNRTGTDWSSNPSLGPLLTAQLPPGDQFGWELVFSPDGSLFVGEIYGGTNKLGLVNIFDTSLF